MSLLLLFNGEPADPVILDFYAEIPALSAEAQAVAVTGVFARFPLMSATAVVHCMAEVEALATLHLLSASAKAVSTSVMSGVANFPVIGAAIQAVRPTSANISGILPLISASARCARAGSTVDAACSIPLFSALATAGVSESNAGQDEDDMVLKYLDARRHI